jgi:hypothetical protein
MYCLKFLFNLIKGDKIILNYIKCLMKQKAKITEIL